MLLCKEIIDKALRSFRSHPCRDTDHFIAIYNFKAVDHDQTLQTQRKRGSVKKKKKKLTCSVAILFSLFMESVVSKLSVVSNHTPNHQNILSDKDLAFCYFVNPLQSN